MSLVVVCWQLNDLTTVCRYVASEGDHITLLNVLKAYLASGCDPGWCVDHFISERALKKALVRNSVPYSQQISFSR